MELGACHLELGPALVTGGTGFLGRRLVEALLAQGRQVTVVSRRPALDLEQRGVRWIGANLDDPASVRAACRGMETVFHVAAKVGIWGRYDDFHRTNVLGTAGVIAGCQEHGVRRLVYTSTPSVVYHGGNLAGADESLPLTTRCPAAYPLTKAVAERAVRAANASALRTVALRPHLIFGAGDPHLVPRLVARARAGRLRIVGAGKNRVDLTHIANVVDAHLLAERALTEGANPESPTHNSKSSVPRAAGRAYFITNGEPVVLWDWINDLLRALGIPPVTKHLSLGAACALGAACEGLWRALPLPGEPPMTRFVAKELATDHWFDIGAARRELGYRPRVSMADGTSRLIAALRTAA